MTLQDVQTEDTKMRAKDRIFKLTAGNKTKTTSGLLDQRLFTGDNRLHAIQDGPTCLWYLKYDAGAVPPYLKQRFTSFKLLKNTVEEYFTRRNVKIEEILD